MKLLKWMSKLIVQACLIVVLSTATTFTAIQLYVNELLGQYNVASAMKPLKPADLLGKWSKQLTALATRSGAGEKAAAPAAVPTSGQGLAAEDGKKSGTDPQAPATNPADNAKPDSGEHVPQDAVAVWSQTFSGSDGQKSEDASESSKRVVVSSDEVAKKKEALSNEDKMKLFTLLASRLPQTEVQNISRIAEDGLTADELKELDRILNAYLKPEEYAQVMSILNKY